MKFIFFISNIAMPMIILIIVIYGMKERKNVFDIFLDGAKEGIKITFNIFPTLIGLFVAIGALKSSGIFDLINYIVSPILNIIHFPSELMPLAILRPISGSSSIAIATYTSCIKVKKTRHILLAALCADLVGIITSVVVCNIMF